MNIDKLKKLHSFNVWEGKDGRWRTYVENQASPNGRKMLVKKSEEDLYKALDVYYTAKELVNIEKLYSEWLEYKKLHTTASTYITRLESDWKTFYVNTPIIKKPLTKISKLDLDIWAHALITKYGMTRKKYVNIQTIMRQVLEYAVDKNLIEKNPMADLKIDKKIFVKEKKKSDATQVYTDTEKKEIIKLAFEDFENRVKIYELSPLALIFQFLTGLRIGELCAVRYEDLETQDYIHIQRMLRRDTKTVVPHTKTDYGDRYVYLTEDAKKIIRLAQERQEEYGVSSKDYIFSINNNPITERCVITLLKKYCKKLDILYRSSHKVKKTYGSDLLDAGVSINTTRMMLGHADEKTTLKYYCFDTREEIEKRILFEKTLKCFD